MEKGLQSLEQSVRRDCSNFTPTGCIAGCKYAHDYCNKYKWVIERAEHYAAIMGMTKEEVIECWEESRGYWYMNYYQDANQPLLDHGNVKVFETVEDLRESAKPELGFICPSCGKETKDSTSCEHCDWKAWGLLRTLGKGFDVFIKKPFKHDHVFRPVAWKDED